MANTREWDLWTYWILTAVLGIYAIYVGQTCEELGCLAIIIPIIGIMIISGLELIIGLIKLRKDQTSWRIITVIISGTITVLSLLAMIISRNN